MTFLCDTRLFQNVFYHCVFSSKKFALCFNFVSKLLECVQNRCWKNVKHAKMWSIHHSVVFLRIRWSYYGIYATVSGIFFSMMNYQIWQQLLGHSFTFVYSWQLCFFRLRVTRHLARAQFRFISDVVALSSFFKVPCCKALHKLWPPATLFPLFFL